MSVSSRVLDQLFNHGPRASTADVTDDRRTPNFSALYILPQNSEITKPDSSFTLMSGTTRCNQSSRTGTNVGPDAGPDAGAGSVVGPDAGAGSVVGPDAGAGSAVGEVSALLSVPVSVSAPSSTDCGVGAPTARQR